VCFNDFRRHGTLAPDLPKLRHVFSLKTEGDLMIVLGVGERLKPGFLEFVCQSLQTC